MLIKYFRKKKKKIGEKKIKRQKVGIRKIPNLIKKKFWLFLKNLKYLEIDFEKFV